VSSKKVYFLWPWLPINQLYASEFFVNRLLRNRVSAQQARERKKAYLSDLEVRSKELEHRNAELEERVSTLQRENQMLRQVLASVIKNYLRKNIRFGIFD